MSGVTRPARLSPTEIEQRLRSLPAWTYEGGRLKKEFRFAGFSEAFGFMARVALFAEKTDHHPEWTNVYDRVSVALETHDAGGVTDLDFRLAAEMDRVAGPSSSPASS